MLRHAPLAPTLKAVSDSARAQQTAACAMLQASTQPQRSRSPHSTTANEKTSLAKVCRPPPNTSGASHLRTPNNKHWSYQTTPDRACTHKINGSSGGKMPKPIRRAQMKWNKEAPAGDW